MSPEQKLRDNDAAAIRSVRRDLERIRIQLPAEGLKEIPWYENFQDEEELEEEAELGKEQ